MSSQGAKKEEDSYLAGISPRLSWPKIRRENAADNLGKIPGCWSQTLAVISGIELIGKRRR